MDASSLREKIDSAIRLLSEESTTLAKVERVLTLMHGVDSRIDKRLADINRALGTLKNVSEGDVVELTLENLPEETERDKKRKRAILFLLKSIKELRLEIERVREELSSGRSPEQEGAETLGKIAAYAKGPFGIITLLAVIVVFSLLFLNRGPSPSVTATPSLNPTPSPRVSPSPTVDGKIKVISYGGEKIPLSALAVRTGPDCTNSPTEASHYHAANGQYVTSVGGTQIDDPGGCAFGKVSQTKVEEINPPDNASQGGFGRTAF